MIMFPLGICVTLIGILLLAITGGIGDSIKGIGEAYEGVEMNIDEDGNGLRDPIEHVFFDVDTSDDSRQYSQAPAVGRVVLI
jgi:hypothetical protein